MFQPRISCKNSHYRNWVVVIAACPVCVSRVGDTCFVQRLFHAGFLGATPTRRDNPTLLFRHSAVHQDTGSAFHLRQNPSTLSRRQLRPGIEGSTATAHGRLRFRISYQILGALSEIIRALFECLFFFPASRFPERMEGELLSLCDDAISNKPTSSYIRHQIDSYLGRCAAQAIKSACTFLMGEYTRYQPPLHHVSSEKRRATCHVGHYNQTQDTRHKTHDLAL